ncbi:hypothetical protein J3R83DRAFT_3963 [Lanmaoa asiatica]|nr:hypothetical protein J3R83DRAFT_3963 [Lanmaoa asiatica]
MKVYIAAIEGYVPCDIVKTFRAFLEFCYLVRKDVILEANLDIIDDTLSRFHHYREVFKTSGVVNTFSLPRQHSLTHYNHLIWQYGAPNGLCSSITESKHVKAVKKPYRVSTSSMQPGLTFRHEACSDVVLEHWGCSCQGYILHVIVQYNSVQRVLDEQWGTGQTENSEVHPAGKEAASQPDDLEDSEDIDGPRIDAHVLLARTPQRKRENTVQLLAIELAIPHLPHLV